MDYKKGNLLPDQIRVHGAGKSVVHIIFLLCESVSFCSCHVTCFIEMHVGTDFTWILHKLVSVSHHSLTSIFAMRLCSILTVLHYIWSKTSGEGNCKFHIELYAHLFLPIIFCTFLALDNFICEVIKRWWHSVNHERNRSIYWKGNGNTKIYIDYQNIQIWVILKYECVVKFTFWRISTFTPFLFLNIPHHSQIVGIQEGNKRGTIDSIRRCRVTFMGKMFLCGFTRYAIAADRCITCINLLLPQSNIHDECQWQSMTQQEFSEGSQQLPPHIIPDRQFTFTTIQYPWWVPLTIYDSARIF